MHASITGLPFSNNLRLAKIVRAGLPARTLKSLAIVLEIDLGDLAKVIGASVRTIERRIATGARLTSAESDRVVRLCRIYAKTRDVFEDRHEAAAWLAENLDALAGETPLQASDTEAGAREVERILSRIEHGVIS